MFLQRSLDPGESSFGGNVAYFLTSEVSVVNHYISLYIIYNQIIYTGSYFFCLSSVFFISIMKFNLPETLNCISLTCLPHITHPSPPKKEIYHMIMHRILKQQGQESNTFSHVVIHSEFEVFTAADHSY